MAKRKKRTKRPRSCTPASGDVGQKLRVALRSIIRDWKLLFEPLPVDEANAPPHSGGQRFRVRGADSYEELQERVLEFAGRVWQLKDGLFKWLETQPALKMVFPDANTVSTLVVTGGQDAERTIEDAAKLCVPLLLCADLYNTHKHYDDCDRSGYEPFLSGVQFKISKSGAWGIRYDGARKTGDITVANPNAVKIRIEILSRNSPVNLGDAVVNVARAFKYWIPLIRQMDLLSPSDREDGAILEDLAVVDQAVDKLDPFDPNDAVIKIDQLPVEQRRLAAANLAEFTRKIQQAKK